MTILFAVVAVTIFSYWTYLDGWDLKSIIVGNLAVLSILVVLTLVL